MMTVFIIKIYAEYVYTLYKNIFNHWWLIYTAPKFTTREIFKCGLFRETKFPWLQISCSAYFFAGNFILLKFSVASILREKFNFDNEITCNCKWTSQSFINNRLTSFLDFKRTETHCNRRWNGLYCHLITLTTARNTIH